MAGRKRKKRQSLHSRQVSRLMNNRIYRYALTLALGALLFSPMAIETVPMPDVKNLTTRNPVSTDVIQRRTAEAFEASRALERKQSWVALSGISPHLRDAVILSEDITFYNSHMKRFLPWSGSAITRRLADNLYFGGEKSIGRSAGEWITILRLERTLGRDRLFEIYLNVIEWGDGIYGAEAAARHYFQKSAAGLSPREAALLACSIPTPLESNPARPGRELGRRADLIVERLESSASATE